MPQAPRIPSTVWEAQRARITELYVSQDKTLDEVIQIMAESGFHATKPQYIRKVNVNWKLQKNYTKEKWQHASALVEKRQAEGKLTKLSIDGKTISEKKKRKELRRYHSLQVEQDLASNTTCGVVAYTPPSSNSKVVLIGNLPWLNFRESFNKQVCSQFPLSNPNRQDGSLGSWEMETLLPWGKYAKGETPTSVPLQGSPEFTSDLISKNLDTTIQRLFEIIPEVANSLKAPQHQEPPWLQIFNSLVFLCSNNLAGTDKTTYDILQVAISSGFLIRIKHLLTMRGPTLEIFAVHLLFVALRVEGSRGMELLRFLLESGVPADSLDPNDCRCSALSQAVRLGNRAAVQLLLTFKADPEAKIQGTGDDILGSPLNCALHLHHDKMMAKMLMDSGANANSGYLKPLLQAVRLRSPDLTRYMLRMGADPKLLPAGGFSVMYFAICHHDLILVDMLIKAGINLNLLVEELQNTDIEFLRDRSKSLASPVITPIQLAVLLRNDEIVNGLIEGGALLDKYIEPRVFESMGQTVESWMLWTPLQISAEQCMEKTTKILLDAGAAVDVRHPTTPTALQLACRLPRRGQKKTELVEVLLDGGADINAPPGEDREPTTMEAAAGSDDHDVFKILWRKGGDCSPSDSKKRESKVFQAALRLGSPEIMTYVFSELESQGRPADFLDGTNYLEETVATGDIRLLEAVLRFWVRHALHWPRDFSLSALKLAIRKRFTHLTRLLDAGLLTVPEEDASSIICESIWSGDRIMFDFLMKRFAGSELDCAQPGYPTPLWLAMHQGEDYMALRLIDGGADLNQQSLAICRKRCCCGTKLEVPLKQAIRQFDSGFIKTLANKGAIITCLIDGCQTPLLLSLEESNESAAELFLTNGADPNVVDLLDERTALGIALHQDISLSTVKLLIHHGADVNKVSMWGTPLEQVSRGSFRHNDAVQRCQLLLTAGANVNASTGMTALQLAVASNKLELSRLLIESGANINASETGMTALEMAIENNNLGLAKLIIEAGADMSTSSAGTTALQFAVNKNSQELAELLIEAGADPNATSTGRTALEVSVDNNNTDLAMMLVEAGARVNTSSIGTSALGLALINNNVELAKLFLARGADVNDSKMGETVLQRAANLGNLELVKHIINRGAEVDARAPGSIATALQYAAMHGNIKIAKYLVERGASVNQQASHHHETTALGLAVKNGHTKAALYLIEKGASIDERPTANHETPLQLAAKHGNHKIVTYLVENGAAVNEAAATERGATALQYAAMAGNIKMAVFLLENGAHIGAKGAELVGRTALEGAAEHGRLDMVYLLLDNDEEPDTIEERCCNAAQFAEAEHHDVIARILRNYKKP